MHFAAQSSLLSFLHTALPSFSAMTAAAAATKAWDKFVQPLKDLADLWSVDIEKDLTAYLTDLHLALNAEGHNVNFAEAAFLVQNSAQYYSKKVRIPPQPDSPQRPSTATALKNPLQAVPLLSQTRAPACVSVAHTRISKLAMAKCLEFLECLFCA